MGLRDSLVILRTFLSHLCLCDVIEDQAIINKHLLSQEVLCRYVCTEGARRTREDESCSPAEQKLLGRPLFRFGLIRPLCSRYQVEGLFQVTFIVVFRFL